MSRTRNNIRRVQPRAKEKTKPKIWEKTVPIIIEFASDGFTQIYGPSHVRVVAFNRLHAIRSEEANLVDEFHELEIPKLHRQFYNPKYLLKSHLVERRTVAGETRRRERLAELRAYRTMVEDNRKKGARRK